MLLLLFLSSRYSVTSSLDLCPTLSNVSSVSNNFALDLSPVFIRSFVWISLSTFGEIAEFALVRDTSPRISLNFPITSANNDAGNAICNANEKINAK
jgi:hypothetical protein